MACPGQANSADVAHHPACVFIKHTIVVRHFLLGWGLSDRNNHTVVSDFTGWQPRALRFDMAHILGPSQRSAAQAQPQLWRTSRRGVAAGVRILAASLKMTSRGRWDTQMNIPLLLRACVPAGALGCCCGLPSS